MLDTIVVDDEFHALERLRELVLAVEDLNLVEGYNKASRCLNDIKEEQIDSDVLFLDIEMPGSSGLELARKLFDIDESIDVIFVTAYDSYAVEAFELNALDYLLKPITEERFQKSIERLLSENKEGASINRETGLKVSSLGQFELLHNGRSLEIEWPTTKTKELFLYLLYHRGDFVARDKIITALWNKKPPEKAVDILYTTVYSLRKIFKRIGIEDIIKSKRGFYGINLEEITWDMLQFKGLVEEIRLEVEENIEKIDRILELYQGEFLIEESYNWLHEPQAELEKEFKNTLFKVADYYQEQGNYEAEEKLLHRIVDEAFLSERAYKRLINLYKKKGQETAARRKYEEFKRKFQAEFGIEPQIEFE